MQPTASFDIVNAGLRKGQGDGALRRSDIWINGAFRDAPVFRYMQPGEELAGALSAIDSAEALLTRRHTGFWQCMDTFKDKQCPRS